MTKKPIRNFVQEAIKGLSPSDFSEFIRIFQLNYWKYEEVIDVDGSNDGGCDIKVYKNKKETKKCIQITTQKTLDAKIKRDLNKVSLMISKYKYSPKFEFYCTIPISEEKIDEYKKFAIDNYDIDLDIYEAKRLSQINCREAIDFIYSLHDGIIVNPETIDLDKSTKILYDLLANGKDSTDIKNSFIDSVIISILYEKSPINISDLKKELEYRIQMKFPDIQHSINRLKTDKRVVKDASDSTLLCLSEDEIDSVRDIYATSGMMEREFKEKLSKILSTYNITFSETIFEKLVELYKTCYKSDLDSIMPESEQEPTLKKIFENFKKYLLTLIPRQEEIDSLINEIYGLCEENNYLNRISASESFLGLYKSNKLEKYLNKKKKDIYLDTPAFVYFLCSCYGAENKDWDNPYYKSVKSLYKLQEEHPDQINFCITRGYLQEVVGEIMKALQFSKIATYNYNLFKNLGETRNSLINYYFYLKRNGILEENTETEITSFEDFLIYLCLDNVDVNDKQFYTNTMQALNEFAELNDIQIIEQSGSDNFWNAKTAYEKILLKDTKNKSRTAIKNDVNQVLLALEQDNLRDCYLATWDNTIYKLRDKLRADDELSRYSYFYIYNPARLSNKIALECFNINRSALTNEIFAYADSRYDISNRMKSLLELIAPFFNKAGKNKLIRTLAKIRKEQLEVKESETESRSVDKNLPIEDIFIRLLPDDEMKDKDKTIMEKFASFISEDNNEDFIMGTIDAMMKMDDYMQYDLTEFYRRINEIEISSIEE